MLIVNESSETVQPDKSPNPLNDHATDNEVMIREEEMAVDLSMTSNNTAGGKFLFCFFWSTGVVTQVYFLIIHHLTLNYSSDVLSEADIINVLGWDEGIDTMEYMVEYLMKPIDKKDEHTELNLNPTEGIPSFDISSTSKPDSSRILTNYISDSQCGIHRYQNSLTKDIEKLKKVF